MRPGLVMTLWLAALTDCPQQVVRCVPPRTGRVLPTSMVLISGRAETVSFEFDGPGCTLPDGALFAEAELTDEAGTKKPVTALTVSQDSSSPCLRSRLVRRF